MFKLLTHPSLSAKTDLFKSLPETTIRFSTSLNAVQSEGSVKFVYVFQREYATVDPAFVELVGTDELTTCVGLVIRNQKNGNDICWTFRLFGMCRNGSAANAVSSVI